MEYITLNNGVEMPVLGYGTYQTPPRPTKQCAVDALRAGYRSIDTAQCYGNEHEVGLACGQNGIFKNRTLLEIAGNHSRSAAQVALQFLLQQGIVVIPKSTHIERMKENLAALDFDLEAAEMREIEQLEIGKSLFNWW